MHTIRLTSSWIERLQSKPRFGFNIISSTGISKMFSLDIFHFGRIKKNLLVLVSLLLFAIIIIVAIAVVFVLAFLCDPVQEFLYGFTLK
jgi:hypothetical protein